MLTPYPLQAKAAPGIHFELCTEVELLSEQASHAHDFFEMIFISGRGGTFQLGSETYAIQSNSLFFVAPYTLHNLRVPAQSQMYALRFGPRFLGITAECNLHDLNNLDLRRVPLLAPFVLQQHLRFDREPELVRQVVLLLQALHRETQYCSPCSEDILRSLVILLLGSVFRSYERAILTHLGSSRQRPRNDALSRTLRFIHERLHQKLTLEDVARHVYLSPTYLARLLKRETGKTFVDLVTEKRLEHSIALLLQTSLTIREIARQVGFEDAAYFARRFRQELGSSPSVYRNRQGMSRHFAASDITADIC